MWATWPTTYNGIVTNLNALTSTIGGAFYFGTGSTGSIITTSDIFNYCYTTSSGAIFNIPSGMSITDTSSTFSQNAGLYGG
jgi:hypothetical protein